MDLIDSGTKMHIGIDASCWSNQRGFGRFTREMLRVLPTVAPQHEYLFFADQATASASSFPEGVHVAVAETDTAPTEAASSAGRRSLRDVWALARLVFQHDLDAFFFPAVYSYFPILNRVPILLTVHDIIAHRHPEATFPNKKLMYFWKLKQYVALFQADRLLTVSEASRAAISDYFNMPASRIHVTTEAANPAFRELPHDDSMEVLRQYGLRPGERFMLYVGGISPHKNLGRLIEAYRQLLNDPALVDVKLVLVGDYERDAFHSDYPRLKQQIGQHSLEEQVLFTGFVSDEDLVFLYNAATLHVFPSLEEGFGLPAVEAMSCGTPVVASDRSSLPEIVGEAGCFFDPLRPEHMAEVLRPVLQDEALRQEMSQKGRCRADQFTWEAAAQKTAHAFEQLA